MRNLPTDTFAPESELPSVDNIALWRVAVAVALGLVVFTFACAVMP